MRDISSPGEYFSETDIGLLRSATLFQGLPRCEAFETAFAAVVRDPNYQMVRPAGERFLLPGGRNCGLFLVVHGIVELYSGVADTGGKIIELIKAGGMFGEETLFNQQRMIYAARTVTSSAVLQIPESKLAELLALMPDLALRLMGVMSERVHYLYKDIFTFCTKNATARLVCYLVCQFEHAPRTPDGTYSLSIPIPRKKIAARLGISDSHLSRAFKELESRDLIRKTRNGFFVPDVPALSRYVCPAGCDW